MDFNLLSTETTQKELYRKKRIPCENSEDCQSVSVDTFTYSSEENNEMLVLHRPQCTELDSYNDINVSEMPSNHTCEKMFFLN